LFLTPKAIEPEGRTGDRNPASLRRQRAEVIFDGVDRSAVFAACGLLTLVREGIPVRVFAAPTWSNLAQLAHHTRDDVIIGEGDIAAAKAATEQLIKGPRLQLVWRLVSTLANPKMISSKALAPQQR
jgi:hypothetical protein